MNILRVPFVAALLALATFVPAGAVAPPEVKTSNGIVQGVEANGVRAFRGIPFAAPPVGELRWKPPQPVKPWSGVRASTAFGPRCMQRPIFGDMVFRSNGMSEDCLYLNIWTPAPPTASRLPVLVYIFGGGFWAGDGSEPRYDGESMARRGIVALTINYRLNVFGFFAHPELTKESPQHASGNYGLLDQAAALRWVHDNIAAFGGDPARVTIAGESAGSISVSAQMASPLSRSLIAGAIGESGAMIAPTLPAVPLADGERNGQRFAERMGAASLAALRASTAEQVLEATAAPGISFNSATVDGYFLPKPLVDIFTAGQQARVPLLAGWNSAENPASAILGEAGASPEGYRAAIAKLYGDRAADILKAYPGDTSEQVQASARELASDRFIAYSTWKWLSAHAATSGRPVYRYYYTRPRPGAAALDAVHSAEIEYAMGTLSTNTVYAWTPDDHKVSELLQTYFANFVKTGNPNGAGVPRWDPITKTAVPVMRIDVVPRLESSVWEARYHLLDTLYGNNR